MPKGKTGMKRLTIPFAREKLSGLFIPLGSLVLALIMGGVLLFISGYNPIAAYGAMITGAFGSLDSIADTLGIATPLILCGVAVAIAMVGGVINIGCEGQLYTGALCAAVLGIFLPPLPPPVLILLCFCGSLVGGGLWAGLAGYLKYKMRSNEVVLTIMLNYIAIFLTDYIVTVWLKAPGMSIRTPNVQAGAVLPVLYPYSRFTIGFLAAVAAVVIVRWLLKNTAFGFEVRAMGMNPLAAVTAGINTNRQFVITMFISGALAGLAGGIEVLGVHKYFIKGFSPGYGYDGLAIAVLGQNDPAGVFAAALLYGALRSGAQVMDRATRIPKDFVVVLQALIIIFVATPGIVLALRKSTRGPGRLPGNTAKTRKGRQSHE
ncbi:MAG: ABC transporter permease [Treponema sp.]|jgi:simple sugar transport system permease protein|nr:ABC transporter permease [Treponema sp.]